MVDQLPKVGGGWRLPDLAWGAEAWAVLRLKVPVASLPATGSLLSVLWVSIEGLSLAGEPMHLERTGLALPVLSRSATMVLEPLVQKPVVQEPVVQEPVVCTVL